MTLLTAVQAIAKQGDSAHDLDKAIGKLYEQAEMRALEIEDLAEDGSVTPVQVCPHLEHLVYEKLKGLRFKNEDQFQEIKQKIEAWTPSVDDESRKNVMQLILLRALNHVYIKQKNEEPSEDLSIREKEESQDAFLAAIDSCYEDKARMADAINASQYVSVLMFLGMNSPMSLRELIKR